MEKELILPKCNNSECPNYGKEMEYVIGEPEVWSEYKCKKCNHSIRFNYLAEINEEKCPYFGCESSDVKNTGKMVKDRAGKEYPLYQCIKCKKRFVLKET